MILVLHVGIWVLGRNAQTNCHAMQDVGIDVWGLSPCRNEALLDQNGQCREFDFGVGSNWLWRYTNRCCLQHLEFLLDFR
jgi:hypothetical protein